MTDHDEIICSDGHLALDILAKLLDRECQTDGAQYISIEPPIRALPAELHIEVVVSLSYDEFLLVQHLTSKDP